MSLKVVWMCTLESWKETRSLRWMDGDGNAHTDSIQLVYMMYVYLESSERIWVRAWSRFSMAVCNSSSKVISLSPISSQRSVRSAASLHASWQGKGMKWWVRRGREHQQRFKYMSLILKMNKQKSLSNNNNKQPTKKKIIYEGFNTGITTILIYCFSHQNRLGAVAVLKQYNIKS